MRSPFVHLVYLILDLEIVGIEIAGRIEVIGI